MLFAGKKAVDDNWISETVGLGSVQYQYVIRKKWADVQLLIEYDLRSNEKNRAIFEALYADRAAIEAEVGEPLDWDYKPERRSQYVRKRFTSGGLVCDWTWPALQDDMINAMIRFDRAIRPRLLNIKL
jgi:hypothetical protein